MRPLILLASLALFAAGCERELAEVEPEEAASDEQVAAGGVVRLSQAEQAAIQMRTVTAARRDVRRQRRTTGWLAARPGSEAIVKAPATGFVTPPQGKGLPLGEAVAKSQHVADLQVFLSPQEQAQLVVAKEEADTLIRQSQATLELAQEQLDRLEQTASTAVAGTRMLALRESIARARAAEQEAREKLPFLPDEPYDAGLRFKTVSLEAPLDGRVISLQVAPRQLVVQGEPLWTIADWSRLWVRVPVFVADVPDIARGKPIRVDAFSSGGASSAGHSHSPGHLGQSDDAGPSSDEVMRQTVLPAVPVDLPQATAPDKQTVELLYEVGNSSGALRPGQAVGVWLPLGETAAEIVVPRSAILWDGMGNAWVYVKAADHSFRRRKVELGSPQPDGGVVVQRGLSEGEIVVSIGAESLYGEEFKSQIQLEDDD